MKDGRWTLATSQQHGPLPGKREFDCVSSRLTPHCSKHSSGGCRASIILSIVSLLACLLTSTSLLDWTGLWKLHQRSRAYNGRRLRVFHPKAVCYPAPVEAPSPQISFLALNPCIIAYKVEHLEACIADASTRTIHNSGADSQKTYSSNTTPRPQTLNHATTFHCSQSQQTTSTGSSPLPADQAKSRVFILLRRCYR